MLFAYIVFLKVALERLTLGADCVHHIVKSTFLGDLR